MLENDNDTFRTIYFNDLKPFLPDETAQRTVLRYLHDRGIEGEIGVDGMGKYIRYYKPEPEERFQEFSLEFYNFITSGGK